MFLMFRCGGDCDFLITYVENSLVERRNHMCLTLVWCDRCSSNQCEVDIWCVVVNPPSLKNLLERFWDHFRWIFHVFCGCTIEVKSRLCFEMYFGMFFTDLVYFSCFLEPGLHLRCRMCNIEIIENIFFKFGK